MHDDDLDVFLNGTQVLQATAWNTDYADALSAAVAQAIVVGKNTLPVTLGAGVFRYRWESKRGILQGTLLKLP